MNAAFRRSILPVSAFASTACASSGGPSTDMEAATNSPQPKLLFLGTGSSTGCPKPLCAMLFPPRHDDGHAPSQLPPGVAKLRDEYRDSCHTSRVAAQGDPKHNKDYRNNPCFLISHCPEEDGDCKNIIIDVGKTFREGALRWFPDHGVATLDAIVLTHHHMDAAGGLDDVRGFQEIQKRHKNAKKPPTMVPMPLYLSPFCLKDVAERFPWLFPKQQPGYRTGSEDDAAAVERHVASFDIHEFQPFEPFLAAGLEIVPLPVLHGDDLICFGFGFSIKNTAGKVTNVVYISDISKMIPDTLDYIRQKLPPTDIFVIDALMIDRPHPVHFSLEQAIELSQQIHAKQTYVVGMNCDAFPPHEQMNQRLKQRQQDGNHNIRLAYDGQEIKL